MQNLQKSIRTNAELIKVHSDKCRTYKIPFGQMQNLQKSIRTNAELTKISKKFGQMHAPRVKYVLIFLCILFEFTALLLVVFCTVFDIEYARNTMKGTSIKNMFLNCTGRSVWI